MKKNIFTLSILFIITIQSLAQTQQPIVKWKFRTEGPIRSKAIIHEEKMLFGNSAGKVFCLNKLTGNLIWEYKTGGAITASPALDNAGVFVTSRDGYVYALDVVSGKLRWRFKMGSLLKVENGGWKYFSASPVILDSRVYIGSGDGNLYVLDNDDGQLIWKFSTRSRIRATPLIGGNTIYLPSNDGQVYALDLKTGKHRWTFATTGASIDPKQFAFDRKSIYDQPSLHNNLLIFGSRDGNVYAVDINTGKAIWKFAYGTTWAMATTLDEKSVYVGWSTNNLVSAIDINTGKERWQFKCRAHVYTKPLWIENKLYVGSADGNLYCLNKESGEKIWTYTIGREIYSSPLYEGRTLFFGSDDGYFYALEETPKPFKAVYQPDSLVGNIQYLLVDANLTPYLENKDFQRLNTKGLFQFVSERIKDKIPSVIVFTLPLIPKEVIGENPENGLMRQYLDSGGKIIWMGDVPNFYEPDNKGNFKREVISGTKLLDISYDAPRESGNYYSKTTREGLHWGLPAWFKSTGSIVSPSPDVIPLAFDEFNRISAWYKKFNKRSGSGFISCRSWAWNVQSKEEDLELIHRLAVYGLE